MFQSIMKRWRPFLADDLCLKVALSLNYVSVTQNIEQSSSSEWIIIKSDRKTCLDILEDGFYLVFIEVHTLAFFLDLHLDWLH